MHVNFITNESSIKPTGLVCVVDVIRAFTTAAYVLHQGAEKIILVATPEEAFLLRNENPTYLLMGEEGGYKIEGFDFGNSPAEIASCNLSEKILIHRTSNGTQGVIRNLQAEKLIVGSFSVAEATLKYIQQSGLEEVTFVVTNNFRSNEDAMFANYIADRLFGNDIDYRYYLDLIKHSRELKKYLDHQKDCFNPKDIDYVCDINKFNFAMEVKLENEMPVLRKVFVD